MHRFPSYLIPVLLCAMVTAVWLTVSAHWNPATWRSPGGPPRGDILEVAARVQVSSEQFFRQGNTYGKIARLGAPAGADWSLYPIPDRVTFALAGRLVPAIGVYGVINLFMLLAHLLGAGSFYFCARLLRWHPAWAAAGALLFSFAVFNQQWSGTISLGWTFALPPAVLLFQWVARRGGPPHRRVVRRYAWLAAGTGLWVGGGNPYFGFVVGQLIGFALGLQWCRSRQRARLRVGGLFLLTLLAGFACTHAPYFMARFASSESGPIDRNYAGSEIYALKPIELLLPPPSHRSAAFAALGRTYAQISALRNSDPPASYLGLAGLAGLLILLGTLLRQAVTRRPVPDAALASLWVLLLSCVGGINSLLAYLGLDIFRASNRFVIFIFIWCLFAFISWARSRTAGRPLLSWGFATGVVVLGLLDQLPRGLSAANHAAGSAALAVDAVTAGRITTAAGASARIFLLPAVPFPEAETVHQFTDYEHLRLFLASPSISLSYGGLKGSLPERWGRWATGLPASALIAELELRGFSVLILDRRAAPPGRENDRLAAMTTAGAAPLSLPEAPHLAAFLLHPVTHPRALDPDDLRYSNAWDTTVNPQEMSPRLFALSGWYDLERDANRSWRWAAQSARLGIWHDGPATRARFTFATGGRTGTRLRLLVDGVERWSARLADGPAAPHQVGLDLRPGATVLAWELDGKTFRPGGSDQRRLGFLIENPVVSVP